MRSAVIGSACGEGVGVSSRFSLSRCSSSCHLVAPAVIASLCLLRRPVLVVPCSHRSRLPCPMCFVPCPVALSSCPLVVIPVFSCGFLSSFSPFLRLAGLGVLCLLVSFVEALVSFALFSLRLVPLRLLACPPGGVLPPFPSASLSSSHAATPSRPSSCSCLIVPSVRSFVLPVFRQAWAGERGGSFSLCLPLSPSCGRRLAGGE